MKTCHIVGAGDFFPERFAPEAGDYIIAADAGWRHLEALGVRPNLAIGDFDSLGAPPRHPNVEVCPVRKDDTDSLVAVRRALDAGFDRLLLHGCVGGRLDHTLANLQTLVFAAGRGAAAYLIGGDFTATALQGGTLRFEGCVGGFSVFCAGGSAEGVFERGSKYTLDNATLTCDYPVGVSNEFGDAATEISVAQGTLTVMWQDTGKPYLPLRRGI
ncbi:MAG: thiamine diphosphokinase [Oscillospiraceae bacterium]